MRPTPSPPTLLWLVAAPLVALAGPAAGFSLATPEAHPDCTPVEDFALGNPGWLAEDASGAVVDPWQWGAGLEGFGALVLEEGMPMAYLGYAPINGLDTDAICVVAKPLSPGEGPLASMAWSRAEQAAECEPEMWYTSTVAGRRPCPGETSDGFRLYQLPPPTVSGPEDTLDYPESWSALLFEHEGPVAVAYIGNYKEFFSCWDSCAEGGCEFCQADADCGDADACTVDRCGLDLRCAHERAPGCCETDADCEDGLPCTERACVNGQCQAPEVLAGCCTTHADCADEDGVGCTEPRCDLAAGVCAEVPIDSYCADGDPCTTAERCDALADCVSDPLCDDGVACTVDLCDPTSGACTFVPSDAACDDGIACTADSCGSGGCDHAPVHLACGDGNVCTDDLCVPGQGCQHLPNASPCDDGDVCTLADTCAVGACMPGGLMDCDDGNVCTGDRCDPQAGCDNDPSVYRWQQGFEDAAEWADWTLDPASGGVGWQVIDTLEAPEQAVEGTHALYYGSPSAWNFATGVQTSGAATSGPVALPDAASLTLELRTWLDTESSPSWDRLSLSVVVGGAETVLLTKASFHTQGWQSHQVDLAPWAGQSVQLRLAFDSGDGAHNDGVGVLIDDLRITAFGGLTLPCDDGTLCTESDTCVAGSCQGESVDCEDGNACTWDGCLPTAGCVYLDNAEPCDDGDACTTQDTCTSGACVGGPALDCDDGNPCTEDSCDPVAGCDSAAPPLEEIFAWEEDFEDTSPNAWTFTPAAAASVGEVGWWMEPLELAPVQAHQGTRALYYGNPSTWTYESFGANQGSATSELIPLPSEVAHISLALWTWLDTEAGSFYDQFTLTLVSGGGEAVVLDKTDIAMETWQLHEVDLTPWAGSAVQLRFDFATGDGALNATFGVLVDDIRVTGYAEPLVACEDGDACSLSDRCSAGVCTPGAPADCDDGNVCTDDSCDPEIGCVHTPNAADCDDGNWCTLADACSEGVCTGTARDCSDGDACTDDLCVKQVQACQHTPKGPGACDDGNVCTVDSCDPALGCVHLPPDPLSIDWSADFEPLEGTTMIIIDDPLPEEAQWQLSEPQGTEQVGWWIYELPGGTKPSAPQGTHALYYGSLSSWTYDTSGTPNEGWIATPVLELPAIAELSASFSAYIHVESLSSYDHFEVEVDAPGGPSVLLDKSQMTMSAWATYQLDLSPWAGQGVRLRFRFDTVDKYANNTFGVAIDELVVSGSGEPLQSCDDGDACTTDDTCSAGVCAGTPSCP